MAAAMQTRHSVQSTSITSTHDQSQEHTEQGGWGRMYQMAKRDAEELEESLQATSSNMILLD